MNPVIELRWQSLLGLTGKLVDPAHRCQWVHLLCSLRNDRILADGTHLLGMQRAPAASRNHHALEGGLVEHLLQMWSVWTNFRQFIVWGHEPSLCDSVIWQQILLHDLEKADYCFTLVSASPWKVEYYKDPKRLLSSDFLRPVEICGRFGIQLSSLQLNALANAHGGYSSTRQKAVPVMAKIVYLLDEWSGNVLEPLHRKDPLNLLTVSS